MKINELISVTLSETDKKVLLVICFLFLLLLLLLGLLRRLYNYKCARARKKIETHLANYYKYGIVDNAKALTKLGNQKNHVMFFKEALIPMIILVTALAGYAIYGIVIKDFKFGLPIYNDLIVKFDITTVKLFGINVISELPKAIPGSFKFHNDLNGYFAYSCLVLFFVGSITYFSCVINMFARRKEVRVVVGKAFNIKMEDVVSMKTI